MKVLVTGSRDFADRELVWRLLDDLLRKTGFVHLLHGACPTGADKHADDWARTRLAERALVLVDRYPANWDKVGRAAGMIRNQDMVNAMGRSGFMRDQRLCLAFFQPGATNKGTSDCAKKAKRAGIEVRRYGQETRETRTDEEETLPL